MAYVIKRGSHTAIVVLELTSQISIIEMSDEPLRIRTTNKADLTDAGWSKFDYPVEKAAARYLNHPAGVSPDARRALAPLIKEQSMSIEDNLTRLVAAVERIATALEQRQTVDAAAVAEAAVETARTKGRGKKAAEPVAEAPAPTPAPAPEPAAEAPAPAPVVEAPAPVVEAPAVKDVQARAIELAKKHGREKVQAVVAITAEKRGTGGAVSISQHTPEELIALVARFDALDAPVAEEF